jgi:uncharacterized protein (TIGR00369 family)
MPKLTHREKVRAIEAISRRIPHANLLGICLEGIDGEELTMKMPYREELVGNPETGAIHGGALTVLLDQTLGIASICCDQVGPILTPTLDLRIDHLRVAPARRDIYAVGRVYRVTRRIVFVEGFAYCESRELPIARATGSWVLMSEIDTRTLFSPSRPETPA